MWILEKDVLKLPRTNPSAFLFQCESCHLVTSQIRAKHIQTIIKGHGCLTYDASHRNPLSRWANVTISPQTAFSQILPPVVIEHLIIFRSSNRYSKCPTVAALLHSNTQHRSLMPAHRCIRQALRGGREEQILDGSWRTSGERETFLASTHRKKPPVNLWTPGHILGP